MARHLFGQTKYLSDETKSRQAIHQNMAWNNLRHKVGEMHYGQ